MIKIPCGDTHYWMDGILHNNLISAKSLIKEDWDFLYVIDGDVGCGKSVLAQQIAYFVSEGRLTLKQICFTPDQFRSAILNAEKYEAIVFDEAFRGLAGRASLSKVNKDIVELLNEIRQKNLFIFIVLPSMWDLDKYITQHRCSGVFHVYYLPYKKADGSWSRERGHVKFYNKAKIGYTIGNSSVKYIYPKSASFKITFKNFYPINEKSYRAKKGQVLAYVPESKKNLWKDRFVTLYQLIMGRKWCSQRELAELSGYSRESLRVWGKSGPNKTILTPNKGLNDDTFLDIRRDDGKTIQIPAKMS
tara:strand:- start:3426 stop:4337 length:912 start_codon:yes stop_codon:yes gene_type:complete